MTEAPRLSPTAAPIERPLPALRVSYERASVSDLLGADDTLAVLSFARGASDDPRHFDVGLAALGESPCEVWRGSAPVRSGRSGALRYSADADYLFFSIEVDERASGGIEAAAETAYHTIGGFLGTQSHPHVLRLWNYLDAINEGDGDDERYRRFCSGRARGMAPHFRAQYPAATAIGRRDGVRVLQVYGLAARVPGQVVENPRQVSAWRYPRQYGPTAPTFARAVRSAAGQLLISGTAAVVGHASQHAGDALAQVGETLANLDSLLAAAGPGLPPMLGAASLLKAYVRDPAQADTIATGLVARRPGALLLLAGDICRTELTVEVDGIHG